MLGARRDLWVTALCGQLLRGFELCQRPGRWARWTWCRVDAANGPRGHPQDLQHLF